ncbi:unnamed protein product [Arctia plantaginis]|uniref:Uncharacterized protein n=1 Tax=Arctia plantaginis TaxID=874455 RepID=A0A8S0YV40_ARCPL|nr:unnamed protein product [Arctia plantaginis]CAB3247921.1 unnamed protein product [Arctia plantaginis]
MRASAAVSRLILITGDILINTPRRATASHNTQKKQERFFARFERNATKKEAGTRRLRRRPIAFRLQRRAANSAARLGRARARGRAFHRHRLFIYCCAEQRARRACDACVVRRREYGVRRGLSVDRERSERFLRGLAQGESGVSGPRPQPAAHVGAENAATAARTRPSRLPPDDASLTPRADGGGSPPRPASLRKPASDFHVGPFGQRVQAG